MGSCDQHTCKDVYMYKLCMMLIIVMTFVMSDDGNENVQNFKFDYTN